MRLLPWLFVLHYVAAAFPARQRFTAKRAVGPTRRRPIMAAAVKKGAAVVVGVSHMPGIGFAVAKRFAQEGLAVGMVGRQQDRLDAAVAAIQSAVEGASVACCAADTTDGEAIKAALEQLKAQHGAPECLVYNVSARPFPPAAVADIDPARLISDWNTGPLGAMYCSQAVLPDMRAAGKGCIIFTG